MNLASIPLIDNHCHSLLRAQPRTVEAWRACFTESPFPEVARAHVEHTVFYQWAARALGGFYGCAPRAEAILERRNAIDLSTLTRRINADANIHTWLVDYGYAAANTYSHAELETLAGIRVRPILRLEPLIERLIAEAANFSLLLDEYVDTLQDLRSQGYVALKSIIAYRVGLTLSDATQDDARAEFPALQARAQSGGLRIDSKPMLDYLIPLAVEIAAEQEFPIQIHTGFGDPDQDLAKGNPAFLRPLFADKYRGAKIVLLHASYPYIRTLGYLARNEGINQAGMADLLEIRPMTLVRQIDRMEEAGWIERRPDPADRRARRLFLTDKARPILGRIWNVANETRNEALARLSPLQKETLIELLRRVHATLSAGPPANSSANSSTTGTKRVPVDGAGPAAILPARRAAARAANPGSEAVGGPLPGVEARR